jgi:hypothetical protein
MKPKVIALAFALLIPPALSAAQDGHLILPDFQSLQHQATESVNVTLDPWLLRSMSTFMDEKDADSAAMKKLLSGIRSVQVRSFEFATDFAYASADVDAVRKQLAAPGWTQMMGLHNRADHEDVDIYMMIENNRTNGFALIASEPRQLTIINIVGSISMDDLPALENHFHLPRLGAPTAGRIPVVL